MASALLTAAATAAALSIKHYAALSSVHFHDELRVAVVRGLDGVITAYLDEDLPSYASDERIFNRAAKGFRCLPPGGTHMLLTTEDNRAKFIAADLVEEYNFGEAARPPVVVYWRKEKPVSWLSATGGGGAGFFDEGEGEEGGSLRGGNWSTSALLKWAHHQHDLAYVDDEDELDAFHADTAEHVAFASYQYLCEGEAKEFVMALQSNAKKEKAKQSHPIFAAVSSNATLGEKACGLPDGRGLCAMLGYRSGPRLLLPDHLINRTADSIEEWLGGLTQPAYQKLRGKTAAAMGRDEL